jgi:DNA-binding response OmpR family regulator
VKPRKRILVVEDDLPLASMYKNALRLGGFDVHVAHDGIGALWILDQQTLDLVVLDLFLPRLRGEVVLSEIAENRALQHLPVVVVTGSDAGLAAAQATAILRKPCGPDRLLSAISRELEFAA